MRHGVESLYARPSVYMTDDRRAVTQPAGCADGASSETRYLRMPRSAEVSASENAGRANRRSAYFISGAACFGIWMP
jgi:hypothetical protein